MLGGAVRLPTSSAAAAASAATVAVAAHKQFHPNTQIPLDIDSWKEVFMQQANNNGCNTIKNDDASNEQQQQADASDVNSSGVAINLSSRPSSAPTTTTNQSGNNTTIVDQPDSQEQHQLLLKVNNKNHHSTGLLSSADMADAAAAATANSAENCSNGKMSPLHALFQPGLQQMQQFLQSQLQQVANNSNNNNNNNTNNNSTNRLGGFSHTQLQHFMQQQQTFLSHHQQLADAGRKQLEQLMHQLQEQLQINLLQQTHLMQTCSNGSENKSGKTTQAMQHLQIQQQQLISQLQLVQQRLLMLPSFGNNGSNQRKDSAECMDRPNSWKENGNSTAPSSPKHLGNKTILSGAKFNDKEEVRIGNLINDLDKESSTPSPFQNHPLFQHGVCQWPGCDSNFTDLMAFLKHVGREHILDDKSTAQARVQMQIVAQLEHSLGKERERLQSMMAHLHLTKDANMKSEVQQFRKQTTPGMGSMMDRNERSQSEGPPSHSPPPENNRPMSPPMKMRPPLIPPMMNGPPPGSLAAMQQAVSAAAAAVSGANGAGGFSHLPNLSHGVMGIPPTPLSALTAAARGSAAAAAAVAAAAGLSHTPTSMATHMRRRMENKTPLIPMTNGLPYMFDRAGLDIAQEIHRNREFYRTNDVRPPFTYASLIRQAVIESPERQLTLHEIYSWFTTTFAYFRRNAASWKNAIRTNLSLHKCFVRYEDDFGSFWMVDDAEFMKRRHLSRGRPRKYEPNSAQAQQRAADVAVATSVGLTNAAAAQFKRAAAAATGSQ